MLRIPCASTVYGKVDLQVRNLRPFKGKAEMPWTGWGDQAGVGIDEKGASNSANVSHQCNIITILI